MQDTKNTVIFVEVKARSNANYCQAIFSITLKKQQHLIETAQHFLFEHPTVSACRFDVIILLKKQIYWIKDVFQMNSL